MFCLAVQNPRSQNECSQHHKGSLDPESGILDPLEVICSKTEVSGSSFRIPVRVHYHREDPFIIKSLDPTGKHDSAALATWTYLQYIRVISRREGREGGARASREELRGIEWS